MPRALNRGGKYGWSYSIGKGQRTVSDKYRERFDAIEWDGKEFDETWEVCKRPGEGYGTGNRVMVKRF